MIAATLTSPTHQTKRTIRPVTRSNGFNRIFAAAVVNRQFCDMLLRNPQEALQKGYLGETFTLTPEENALIASIQANTLSDLAKQVYGSLSGTD